MQTTFTVDREALPWQVDSCAKTIDCKNFTLINRIDSQK